MVVRLWRTKPGLKSVALYMLLDLLEAYKYAHQEQFVVFRETTRDMLWYETNLLAKK